MTDAGGRLLIVEDNKVNRLLLSRTLELLGHQIALAENGRVGLQMLAEQDFDLVLLDIEMPEMDGFEVLEIIKNDPDLRDLPVIVTSSVDGLENIVRCIELGAEDYLPKPVNKVLLNARVSSGLEKKRLRDEQKRLLERFATTQVAHDLQESGFAIGGKRTHASVLFCDIRDFTALSESLAPEATIELLNMYYTLMFEAISSHGGIVSLMIGDGLMALFGAPEEIENPAQAALDAGQDMLAMIEQLNDSAEPEAGQDLRIGIGIASGDVVAGYAGTNDRATYTCVGPTVNLASRLEAQTKELGCKMLIDSATKAKLTSNPALESYEGISIKGFSMPMVIYSVL